MDNFTNIESLNLLISKCLSGNSTSDEDEELLHWVGKSKVNQQYFFQSKLTWLQADQSVEFSIQNKWEQLENRIENRENKAVEYMNLIEDMKDRMLNVIRYAAVIIGLLGLSSIFYFLYFSKQKTDEVDKNFVIEVPYGSKLNITLPDNSHLWINSGSKVIYNNKFGVENRDIQIIGEAYFDVAKNPDLPFIVHAGNVNIKAIGTAFNVKAYPEENRVETTLVHGIVEIGKQGQKKQFLLKPSEKVVIIDNEDDHLMEIENPIEPDSKDELDKEDDLSKGIIIDKAIDTEKETAWKDGKLIFESEPLETLVVKLIRKYDVTFEFADDKLKTYKFSGTFNDMPLEQIMDAMQFSSPINYEIIEKKVILKGKK